MAGSGDASRRRQRRLAWRSLWRGYCGSSRLCRSPYCRRRSNLAAHVVACSSKLSDPGLQHEGGAGAGRRFRPAATAPGAACHWRACCGSSRPRPWRLCWRRCCWSGACSWCPATLVPSARRSLRPRPRCTRLPGTTSSCPLCRSA